MGSFLACCKLANVTPIPKGSPSSSVANYRHISIAHLLSTVFERLVSGRHERVTECRDVLPTTQFAYRKGFDTCDGLLCASHTIQSAVERRQDAQEAGLLRLTSVLTEPTINKFHK